MSEWLFSPKARGSIKGASARLNLWHGAVRSGKTVSSLIAWLLFVRSAPPGDLLMVGKTERTLKRNILDPLEQMVGAANFTHNRGAGELTLLGRRVYLAGANDERAEGKIRGMTAAGAYSDELTLWPESFFKMLLSRLSVKGARLYGTTNPDGPYHWLKVGYLDKAGELDLAPFHFTLEDNPALDPAYVAALKAEYGEGTLWYKRFIQGLWVAAEGAVYDFFSEREHVAPLPEGAPEHLDVAIDYGTANATAMGLYGAWPGGRSALIRSYTHSGRESGQQKTDSEYAEALRDFLQGVTPRWIILDPSAASFKAELRRRGYRVRDANNDVLDGIRTTARLMKAGRFTIGPDPSNRAAITELTGYVWDTRAQKRGEDKPLKQNDHHCDQIRYYLHSTYGKGVVSMDALRKAAGR